MSKIAKDRKVPFKSSVEWDRELRNYADQKLTDYPDQCVANLVIEFIAERYGWNAAMLAGGAATFGKFHVPKGGAK